MRKFIILLFFVIVIPIITFAQGLETLELNLKGEVNRAIIRSELEKGDKVKLIEISKDEAIFVLDGDGEFVSDGNMVSVNLNRIDRISFTHDNLIQFWQKKALNNGVYNNLGEYGYQYKERRELEDEAIEFLHHMDKNNYLYQDGYLESYIYSLVHKLYPERLEDGRPGILNINILKQTEPNAFIFPNGTLVVTTGLLSSLNSEEELMAVLAHEIAHFVLDHIIININKQTERLERAEFWANFITILGAAADTYATTQFEYHVPGSITLGAGPLAHSVAYSIAERMGMKFSREQEWEADQCAVELLKFINIDPTALSSALTKIREYCIKSGNYYAISGEGTHPDLNKRISEIGRPESFSDQEYDVTFSSINTFNARLKYRKKRLSASGDLLNRNIEAGVATEEDYLLLSKITLNMYDTEEKNKEALEMINKAKSLNVYPVMGLPKQKAIVLMRLDRTGEAKQSLLQYREELDKQRKNLEKIKSEKLWSNLNHYIENEYEWTAKMIHKLNQF